MSESSIFLVVIGIGLGIMALAFVGEQRKQQREAIQIENAALAVYTDMVRLCTDSAYAAKCERKRQQQKDELKRRHDEYVECIANLIKKERHRSSAEEEWRSQRFNELLNRVTPWGGGFALGLTASFGIGVVIDDMRCGLATCLVGGLMATALVVGGAFCLIGGAIGEIYESSHHERFGPSDGGVDPGFVSASASAGTTPNCLPGDSSQ